MCSPLVFSVAMGGMQAISGIQEQNRQHAAQVAAVNRSNQMARQKYINELNISQRDDQLKGKEYEAELKAAAASRAAFYKQKEINQLSANQASTAEQLKLQEKTTKAAFDTQAALVESIQAQGTVLASGQQPGQSLMLELAQAEREYGFEQAQVNATLFDATRAYGMAQHGIDLDQYSADVSAQNQIKNAPTFAPAASMQTTKPIKQSRPSKPSALGPILGGISTAVNMGTSIGGDGYWETAFQ